MKNSWLQVLFTYLLATVVWADAPHISPSDDHKHLGEADDILFWTPHQKVAGFRNQDLVFPVRPVPRGERVLAMPDRRRDLGDTRFSFQGRDFTIDEYFTGYNTAGLLVIKDGSLVYERYALGNSEATRWISFSVTKSITSMLIGAAIQDGHINSLDEKVTDYLPRLRSSSYERVTIRDILHMSSGVEWDETYSDPDADINTVDWQTLALYKYLSGKKRVAEPGKVFNYSTAETNLAGNLLRAAIGTKLSTYLSDRIWRPFGMEHDAYWQLTGQGEDEFGGCCLSATLRDYGRLGLFALNDGVLADGTRILPEGWMQQSVTPSPASPRYGYFWWLGQKGVYEASGIFGQSVYIDPEKNVVIAQHGARERASEKEDWAVQAVAFRALAESASEE